MKIDRKTKRALSENSKGSRSQSKLTGKRLKGKKFSDVQFASMVERINEGFVALDAQMNYIYINQRGSELLQRQPEDLIGKNYWQRDVQWPTLFQPSDR